MSEVQYWVWLSGLHGLRPKTRNRLLENFGGPEEIYFAADKAYDEVEDLRENEKSLLCSKDLREANTILEACQRQGIQVMTLQDAAYPQRLTHIYDPPAVLYIRGRMPWVDQQCTVAIVGTRKATPYGIKMGRQFGYGLSRSGVLVISGLADGVDSAGAKGALLAGGSCIGVLGTAVDIIYPRSNRALFDDVAAVGALVSEYPPGAPYQPRNFPMRNRIIAGLSCGVTVIEAPEKSGALITAERAMESGRDVFAVPGNADAPNCFGSNALIRDGAKAVSHAGDIVNEYMARFPALRLLEPGEMKIPSGFSKRQACTPEPEKLPELPQEAVYANSRRETGEGFAQLRKLTDTGKAREAARRKKLEEQLSQLSETQLKILSVISAQDTQVDAIIAASGLSTAVVLAELTILQIKGYVSQSRGKHFSLNINITK